MTCHHGDAKRRAHHQVVAALMIEALKLPTMNVHRHGVLKLAVGSGFTEMRRCVCYT
jgi:hypothetical protein